MATDDILKEIDKTDINGVYPITAEYYNQAYQNYENRYIEIDGERIEEKHYVTADGSYEKLRRREEVERYRVYEPLATILDDPKIPYESRNFGQTTKIERREGFFAGWAFRSVYIDSFKKGAEYFRKNHTASREVLYGPNSKVFADDIKQLYFKSGIEGKVSKSGWVSVKGFFWVRPFTRKDVEEKGFYTGLVLECESFMEKYPNVFPFWQQLKAGVPVNEIVNPSVGQSNDTTSTESQSEAVPGQSQLLAGAVSNGSQSNGILLRFKVEEHRIKLFDELKGYFKERENDFLSLLNGYKLIHPLNFPSKQNRLIDLFRTIKFGGYILNDIDEIISWLCENFQYRGRQNGVEVYKPINENTANDIFSKNKGIPKSNKRIKIDFEPNTSN